MGVLHRIVSDQSAGRLGIQAVVDVLDDVGLRVCAVPEAYLVDGTLHAASQVEVDAAQGRHQAGIGVEHGRAVDDEVECR